MPQCKFRKQDGKRCRAHAMHTAKFCISHNPKAKELKKAATAKGGRNRRTFNRAAKPSKNTAVRCIEDVKALLFQTLEDLRNGTLNTDLARAVGYLAGVTAKVVETVQLEKRIDDLEESYLKIVERTQELE